MNINEPCLSMVNPKLLLLIFSSLHDALEITCLINISTRNAVCVITGRHLMVSEFYEPSPTCVKLASVSVSVSV